MEKSIFKIYIKKKHLQENLFARVSFYQIMNLCRYIRELYIKVKILFNDLIGSSTEFTRVFKTKYLHVAGFFSSLCEYTTNKTKNKVKKAEFFIATGSWFFCFSRSGYYFSKQSKKR